MTDPPLAPRRMRKKRGQSGVGRSGLFFLGVAALLFADPLLSPLAMSRPPLLSAQEAEVYWGAALGGYSGATLGLLGSAGVCSRVTSTEACPRVGSIMGGIVGAIGGGVLGNRDPDALRDRLRNAGYGGVIGAAAGYGLMLGIRQFGWADAGTFLALGTGIGASPVGSGIGWGVGALVGTIAWQALPKVKVGDVVALSLLGLSVGGLVGWVLESDGSGSPEEPTLIIPFQISF